MSILNKAKTLVRLLKNLDRIPAIEAAVTGGSAAEHQALLDAQDADGRRRSQHTPIKIPLVPGGYWAKVKIDHDGIFRPHSGEYVYPSVLRLFERQTPVMHEWIRRIEPFLNSSQMAAIPVDETSQTAPYWNNPMFQNGDPRVCYSLVAALKPKRIVEVGSGYSTRFLRRAIDDFSPGCKLIAVDPYPQSSLEGVAHEIIRKSIWDVDLEELCRLEPGDVFFWDGSHITFNGTDTTHFYLNILPLLPDGVVVHVHDIQLPNEYEAGYSAHYYNEQYMLATLLLNSPQWTAILPLHYLGRNGYPQLGGRSLWMIKQPR